jgi:hypothetical protein
VSGLALGLGLGKNIEGGRGSTFLKRQDKKTATEAKQGQK